MDAVTAARWLREATRAIDPGPPIRHVYRPLDYAWQPHKAYLERFAGDRKKVLLLGMNPGAWGMGQTGVPFGDVELAGDWLGLRGLPVEPPADAHPKRPVSGWACTRREGSGRRLWGHLRARFGTPERALRDLLIVNYCPLILFRDGGENVTPDKLPKPARDRIHAVCDEGLARTVEALRPETLIGIGRYAEGRARIIAERFPGLRVLAIPHPSPASPLANQNGGEDWRSAVDAVFAQATIAAQPQRS